VKKDSTSAPFELRVRVAAADIDQLGHVSNIVYLRWVQEAAIAHWQAIAPAAAQSDLFWVVVRHEIDYKRPALPQDEIIVSTWIGGADRLKFERHTEILRASDRHLLAKALTLWCPMDVHTRRPTDVSAEIRSLFSSGEPGSRRGRPGG
jgi:acyl-CoA thioester hydrolase